MVNTFKRFEEDDDLQLDEKLDPKSKDPDLASYESQINQALRSSAFKNEDLGREDFENPEDFSKYQLEHSKELTQLVEAAPQELKEKLKQQVLQKLEKEQHPKWKEASEKQQEALKKKADELMGMSEEDAKNDDFHEPEDYRDAMMKRIAHLKNGLSEAAWQKLEEYATEKAERDHIIWGRRHEIFHQSEIKEAKSNLDKVLQFDAEDVENDEFHRQEVFAQVMKNRSAEAMEGVPDDLKAEIETYQNTQIDALYKKWQKAHEDSEEKKIGAAMLESIRDADIPAEMAKTHLEKDEFVKAFWQDRLEKAPDDIKHDLQEHGNLFENVYKSQAVQAELAKKFEAYEAAHDQSMEQRFSQELSKSISSLNIPEEMAQLHQTDDEFKKNYFELLLQNASPELKEELLEHEGLQEKLFESMDVQTALEGKSKEYEKMHDESMEKKFSGELKELIGSAEISTDFAKTHYSPEAFQEKFYESILEKASPELKEELQEHAGLRKTLFENKTVNGSLSDKYKDYEKKHEGVMEETFSAELVDLIGSEEISSELAREHLEPKEFKRRFFEKVLENASPELREELLEHKDLAEKLFGNTEVEDQLDQKYTEYAEKHESSMEKTFSAELNELIASAEIPAAMANEHLEQEQFRKKFFAQILKKASPELQEELKEHADLQEKLFQETTVQAGLTDKFQEYAEKHEASMEKRFSGEIAELLGTAEVTPEMAKKHYSPEKFKEDQFEKILSKASPELRQELKEHADLRTTLFAQKNVQAGLDDFFEKYEKEHDKSMEKRFTTELNESVRSTKIPAELLDLQLSKAEFSQDFFKHLLKKSSPEMRAELKEHKNLSGKLWKVEKFQAGLEKRYQEYKKLSADAPSKPDLETLMKDLAEKKKIPDELSDLENAKEWTDEQKEQLAEQLDPKMRKAFSALLKKSKPDEESEEKSEQQEKNPVSPEAFEDLKDSDITGKLEEVLDMDIGRERMEALKGTLVIKNLMRKEHLKNAFEGFFMQWSAQMKESDFRLFRMTLNKKGTTPQQALQLLFSNAQGRRAATRIKNHSPDVWHKMNRGLKYLDLKPTDILPSAEKKETVEEKEEKEREVLLKEEDFLEIDQEDVAEPLEEDEEQEQDAEAEERDEEKALEEEEEVEEQEEDQTENKEQENPENEQKVQAPQLAKDYEQIEQKTTESVQSPSELLPESSSEETQESSTVEFGDESSDDTILLEKKRDQDLKRTKTSFEKTAGKGPIQTARLEQEFQKMEKIARASKTTAEKKSETPQTTAKPTTTESKAGTEKQDIPLKQTKEAKVQPGTPEKSAEPSRKEAEKNPANPSKKAPEKNSQKETSIEKKTEKGEKKAEKMVEPSVPKSIEKQPKAIDPLRELERFRRELMDNLKNKTRPKAEAMANEIDPMAAIPTESASEDKSLFLEALRMEMETASMSLGALLNKFIRYIRFINDAEIPVEIQLPTSLLSRLVVDPSDVFENLNDFYYSCRERHEHFPRMIFSTSGYVRPSDSSCTLEFEMHRRKDGPPCKSYIPCILVADEERTVEKKTA